jgi:nucleotide sugar dehydrogenase
MREMNDTQDGLVQDLGEKKDLNKFLRKNNKRKIVVVQGLGFVGSVMSLVVANSPQDEYAVIGVDLPNEQGKEKIRKLNNGEFPLNTSDSKVYELFDEAYQKEKFCATYDTYAYSVADVVIVDINLDVEKKQDENYSLDSYDLSLSGFKKGITSIAENCKEDVLIIVETTVPPGTCQKVVKPILDQKFEERGLGKEYRLAHSYERVMPGPDYVESIINFYRVYSGINEASADAAEGFLRSIIKTDEYPLTRLHSTNATEMAKVLENSYRAMNIAFIQEWTEFAEAAGVNLYEVIRAIRMRPTHANIMGPGLGVGGYCLTKDPLLASWARKQLFDGKSLPESERAVQINDQMPLHAANIISEYLSEQEELKRVLMLGVSYRGDVGDTRNTPVKLLYEKLEDFGLEITLHDPYINYWEEMETEVVTELENLIEQTYDIVIFGTDHSEYEDNDKLTSWVTNNSSMLVLDVSRVLSTQQIEEIQLTNNLKILGRGDL